MTARGIARFAMVAAAGVGWTVASFLILHNAQRAALPSRELWFLTGVLGFEAAIVMGWAGELFDDFTDQRP